VVFNLETFRTIKATYYRTALDLIEMYHNDALMNGLYTDRHQEEEAVELFAGRSDRRSSPWSRPRRSR
jgi:glucosyl-3-phosphoglycerate synthase